MPYFYPNEYRRKRSKEGRKLDKAYYRHEIGWAYYMKIWNKPKYWEWNEERD